MNAGTCYSPQLSADFSPSPKVPTTHTSGTSPKIPEEAHLQMRARGFFCFGPQPLSDGIDAKFVQSVSVCAILKNGTFAMVATTTATSYETLISYSNTFQIPFVSPSFPYHTRLRQTKYGISMRPDYLPAILDLIQHYRWRQIVYIYDSDDGK